MRLHVFLDTCTCNEYFVSSFPFTKRLIFLSLSLDTSLLNGVLYLSTTMSRLFVLFCPARGQQYVHKCLSSIKFAQFLAATDLFVCICLMMFKNLLQQKSSSARKSRSGGPKRFSFSSGRLNRPGPCLEEAFVQVGVAKPTHVLQTSVWSFQGMHRGPQSAREGQQDAR